MRTRAVLAAFGLPCLLTFSVARADPNYSLLDYYALVPGSTGDYHFVGYAGEGEYVDFLFQGRVGSPEDLDGRTVLPVEGWAGTTRIGASYYELSGAGMNLCKELDGNDVRTFSPPLLFLPLNLVPGQTVESNCVVTNAWDNGLVPTGPRTWSVTVAGIEPVTVPAGTYNALRVDWAWYQELFWTAGDGDHKEVIDGWGSYWLAFGIGQVKFTNLGTETTYDWSGGGYVVSQADSQDFVIEAVPEPAALSLLVLGGLAVLSRRR